MLRGNNFWKKKAAAAAAVANAKNLIFAGVLNERAKKNSITSSEVAAINIRNISRIFEFLNDKCSSN